ncbi:2-isopropylmalate synthase [Fodinisporobacter ferrooxydans]|uniref:2-isopropylmalate synthase n=1 Tax=Fodinisporobacter ferrooxydans TaxID=2901836 RepID=A0ABY4CQG0_9BACL|nr:2-isopropylmalate synthase [Alicyclobacillaceae bacterium MYW30-H2]
MRKIDIFDTTLRDGEQSPGVNLSHVEKLDIAKQLARLGVQVIEAGFAAASPGDFAAVREIARQVKGVSICSLARSVQRDIDQAYEAVKESEHPRIHVFLATSDIHMKHKLRMSRDQVLEQVESMVKYTKSLVSDVQFSAEDAGRTDIDFLCQVAEVAIRNGAKVFNVPDTVGYLTPFEYAEIFRQLRKRVSGIEHVKLSAHCHDDLGMAVINSLAAVEAGVDQVEVAVNGIGERAGNAALEEIALALETRKDYYQATTVLDLSQITRASRLVSKLTGMIVPPNKAIVGANAFAHESGIHQDGVLKEKTTYEIIRPETVGLTDNNNLVLGKHSGRHAFREKLESLGYELSEEELLVTFNKFKELCDKKKTVSDDDLIALVDDEHAHKDHEYFEIEYIHISCGNQAVPTATLRLRAIDGSAYQEAAVGNGAVDAIFRAIDRITQVPVELLQYQIHAVTGGQDALGEARVQVKHDLFIQNGRGTSTDILEASAKAYLDAVNRLIIKDLKQQIEPVGEIEPAAKERVVANG